MATLSNTSFFSPTQISGCSLWLDAADQSSIVLSGGNVSVWRDKSGNGYNASNAVSANQPLYVSSSSGNYLSFNGTSSQFLGFTNPNALVANTTFTVIFVEKRQNINANYILGGSATVNANLHTGYASETNIRFGFYGNDLDFSPFSSYNTSNEPTRLWAFDYNGSTRSIILNSSTLVSSNNSTNLSSWANGSIGNFRNAAYYTGNLYEMLIYKPSLSTNQRQQIEGYLAWKWGLQSNLPSTHPFYNYNPNVPNINLFTPTTVITSPTQVSGCSLWLDAADSATIQFSSGINLSNWIDKSGNGRNAVQATSIFQPTYTSNAVIFGLSTFLTTAVTASANTETVFMVTLLSNTTFTSAILGQATGNSGGRQFEVAYTANATSCTARLIRMNQIFVNYTSVPQSPTSISLAEYTNNGTTSIIYWNGATINTSVTPSAFSGSFTTAIGTRGGTLLDQFFNGRLYEILIYSNVLTTAQRQQVEGYLAWKWGLQSSLPTTHPFYNFNPSAPLLIQLATLPIVQSNTTLITMSPTQISGCALWLDAADANTVVLSNTNVTRWNDKSGNGRDALASNTPKYSNSNIDVSTGYFTGAFNIPAASNIRTCGFFVATTPTPSGGYNVLFSANNGTTTDNDYTAPNGIQYCAYQNNTLYTFRSSRLNVNFPNANTQILVTVNYNNSGTVFTSLFGNFPNGSATNYATGSIVAATNNLTKYYLGVNYQFGQNWSRTINEVIIYNRELAQSEYQQIEGYLAWKWGLQANLPTTHPYYYNPLIPNLVLQSQLLSMTPSFSPLRFSGASLWLDAADSASVITSGSAVTRWNDKSGNGKNATKSSNFPQYSQSSLNGLGTLRFNGSSGTGNGLDVPAFDFGTSTRTIFFVVRNTGPVSGTASDPIWLWPYTGNGTNSLSFQGWIKVNNQGTRVEITYSATSNSYLLICFRFGTTTGFEELFNNGTLVGSATKSVGGTSYANATSGYRIGGSAVDNDGIYNFDGNIGEVILYNTTLSTNQRQQIEGYLAWKWGLQSSLPANHPYVLFPPN